MKKFKLTAQLISYSFLTVFGITFIPPASATSSSFSSSNFCASVLSQSQTAGVNGLWVQSSNHTEGSGTVQLLASVQDSTIDSSAIPNLYDYQSATYQQDNLETPGFAFPDLPAAGATPPTTGVTGAYSISTVNNSTISLPRLNDVADSDGVITYHVAASGEKSIDLSGGSNLTLGTGNETIVLYLDAGMVVSGGSSIDITPGTKLIVYAGGVVNLSGGSTTNAINNSDTPDSAEIYVYSSDQVTLSGGSEMKTFIHAPDSQVVMSSDSSFDGTIWANEWSASGSAIFTQGDTNILNTQVGNTLASNCLIYPD